MKFTQRCMVSALLGLAIAATYGVGQSTAKPAATFPPLEQWKAAVLGGNASTLQATLQQ